MQTLRDCFSVPGRPTDIKAVSSDQHTVLVSWLLPARLHHGALTLFTVHMRTMEMGRQFEQQFDVYPPETHFSVRGLNQVIKLIFMAVGCFVRLSLALLAEVQNAWAAWAFFFLTL